MAVVEKQLSGSMIKDLPRSFWHKAIFKTPLYVWRMGFRFMLPSNFACITTRGSKSGLARYTMIEHTQSTATILS